jgi:hypothetical protein
MRLFLSAPTLRRLRIIALKITHLPFIAIILAYEASNSEWFCRSTQTPPTLPGLWPGTVAGGSSDSPVSSRHRNLASLGGGRAGIC